MILTSAIEAAKTYIFGLKSVAKENPMMKGNLQLATIIQVWTFPWYCPRILPGVQKT